MIEADVLFNPNAGRVRVLGMTEGRLLRLLREHGISGSLRFTDGIRQAVRAFADVEPGRVFIVAGGDGTLFQAVQASVCRASAVGIIPLGTANDLARSLGIPLDLSKAAEVIARGHIRRIDLGRVGGRVFIQAAGVGFHAHAFRIYGEHRHHNIVRAFRAFVLVLRDWKPMHLRVTIDGVSEDREVTQVTAANTPVYGRGINICPEACMDDGVLDVVTLGAMTKPEILRLTLSVMKGRPVQAENLTHIPARVVEMSSVDSTPLPVHADGEPICCTPIHIEVLPSCLKLIVPA